MKTPHKHADVIKAWADGAEIQWYDSHPRQHRWFDCAPNRPSWSEKVLFRVKPEPKPDVVLTRQIALASEPCGAFPEGLVTVGAWPKQNIKLTFDGETGKLKAAEVL